MEPGNGGGDAGGVERGADAQAQQAVEPQAFAAAEDDLPQRQRQREGAEQIRIRNIHMAAKVIR